jgi:plastocyanin
VAAEVTAKVGDTIEWVNGDFVGTNVVTSRAVLANRAHPVQPSSTSRAIAFRRAGSR